MGIDDALFQRQIDCHLPWKKREIVIDRDLAAFPQHLSPTSRSVEMNHDIRHMDGGHKLRKLSRNYHAKMFVIDSVPSRSIRQRSELRAHKLC